MRVVSADLKCHRYCFCYCYFRRKHNYIPALCRQLTFVKLQKLRHLIFTSVFPLVATWAWGFFSSAVFSNQNAALLLDEDEDCNATALPNEGTY